MSWFRCHYSIKSKAFPSVNTLEHFVCVRASDEAQAKIRAVSDIMGCVDPPITESEITFDVIEKFEEADDGVGG